VKVTQVTRHEDTDRE